VSDLLTDERVKQIRDNRCYLGAVIDVLKFTATHRLAQRGHDETEGSLMRGNFLDMLHIIGKYNDTVGHKLASISGNAKYTSNDIQQELLVTMARMVRGGIADEVRGSGEFSIMADESKDCRKMEQLSIVLRYFCKGAVFESFVGFIHVCDLSAEGLSSKLKTDMQQLGLDYKSKLIGQGYDGASVMSGSNAGVAALLKHDAPFALYVHCHAHRLNLALVDCMKAVPQAAEFFVLLEHLYVFVSGSFVHARWIEMQRQLYPTEQPRELQRLSDTRWSCRYVACKAVHDRLLALLQLLTEIESGANAKRAVEARALLSSVDCRFVLMLGLMCDVLSKTQSLSVMLQSAAVDFGAVIDLIDVVRTDLVESRSQDARFDKLWSDMQNVCDGTGVNFDCSDDVDRTTTTSRPLPRKRKLPAHLSDSHVLETVGSRPDTTTKDGFRQNVYLPVLDSLLSEFDRRFGSSHCDVLRGISALIPTSDSFADFSFLEKFAKMYTANVLDLVHELHQAKRLVERLAQADKPNTLVSFVSFIERYKDAFPEVYRLGVIAVCLPVSTASCERSFSALRQIKTWVRNSMSSEKLSSLAILAIERERTQSLDNEKIIDAFAVNHNNRRIALL